MAVGAAAADAAAAGAAAAGAAAAGAAVGASQRVVLGAAGGAEKSSETSADGAPPKGL